MAVRLSRSSSEVEAVSSPPKPPVAPNAPQAPQAANMNYGFFMALLGNNSAVKNMGFGWVQYGVYWSTAEPTDGNYAWGDVDNIVNSARESGLNVLIRISRTPTWARDPQCTAVDTCPPANAADLGSFSAALAAHVRSLTPYGVAYEIWNEPNTNAEWGGDTMCPEPERYADMLKAAYPAIKSSDASALVLGGAVTTVGAGSDPTLRPGHITFLTHSTRANLTSTPRDTLTVLRGPEAPPSAAPTGLCFAGGAARE